MFERLTAGLPPESACGEEFKSVLRIIDSAKPDQYRYFAKNAASPSGQEFINARRRCSKNHDPIHLNPHMNYFDGTVYKLDSENAI